MYIFLTSESLSNKLFHLNCGVHTSHIAEYHLSGDLVGLVDKVLWIVRHNVTSLAIPLPDERLAFFFAVDFLNLNVEDIFAVDIEHFLDELSSAKEVLPVLVAVTHWLMRYIFLSTLFTAVVGIVVLVVAAGTFFALRTRSCGWSRAELANIESLEQQVKLGRLTVDCRHLACEAPLVNSDTMSLMV